MRIVRAILNGCSRSVLRFTMHIVRAILNGCARIVLRFTDPFVVAELPVWIVFLTGAERAQVQETVTKALRLLEARDPARLARLQRHVGGIVVLWGGASGAAAWYNENLRLCFVNSETCNSGRPGSAFLLALTLVHEAMHGLLADIGYSGQEPLDQGRRIRIERLCTKAELLVLQRLAPSFDTRAPLEQALLRTLAAIPDTYSNGTRGRSRKAMMRELRQLVVTSKAS
jgi:hypothetical protein